MLGVAPGPAAELVKQVSLHRRRARREVVYPVEQLTLSVTAGFVVRRIIVPIQRLFQPLREWLSAVAGSCRCPMSAPWLCR
jgi:hypothetical protein